MRKKLSPIYLSLLVATLFAVTSCWDGSEDDAYRKKVQGAWVRFDVSANDVVPTTSYTQNISYVLFLNGNGTYETYAYAGNNYGYGYDSFYNSYNDFSSYYDKTDELLEKKGWNKKTTGHWTLANKEIILSEESIYIIRDESGEELCVKSKRIWKANVTFNKEYMFFSYTYNSSTEGTEYAEENIHTHEIFIKPENSKSIF